MATSEEKKELVDSLKGPFYYRIMISGYGGESAYMTISKEAHDFWKEVIDEHGDNDLVQYMIAEGDEEPEYDEVEEVPAEAQFLLDEDYKRPWYESHTEFEHIWGAGAEGARVYIEQVESSEYNAGHVADIIDGEDLWEIVNNVNEETDYEVELVENLENWTPIEKGTYVAQLYSSEKGTFFESIFETPVPFNIHKLRFVIDEAPNGEDTIFGVKYDDVDLDNDGGDTNGKGYYASVWEQEF